MTSCPTFPFRAIIPNKDFFRLCIISVVASLVAQLVKNLPVVQETQVQFLGWEDSPGEGNGNPLQYSCLENPMDRGTWWATVHGVAKSRTRLSDFTFTFHFHSYFKPLPGGPSIILSLQVHKECDRGSSGPGQDLYHEGYGPAEQPPAKATSISTYYRTFCKFCKHIP